MAKKKKTSTKKIIKPRFQKTKSFFENQQTQTIIGVFVILFAIFLLISFISYFFNWQEDQSQLSNFTDKNITVKNLLGKIGASISHFFIYKSFGVAALYIPFLLFFSGISIFLKGKLKKIKKSWGWGVLGILWVSITFGFLAYKNSLLAGVLGYEINLYLQQFLGKTGLILLLLFLGISYLVIRFKLTPEALKTNFKSSKKNSHKVTESSLEDNNQSIELPLNNNQSTQKNYSTNSNTPLEEEKLTLNLDNTIDENIETNNVEIAVDQIVEENHVNENLSDKLLKDFGEFDPTLELSSYKFPTLNLLRDYNESISVNQAELEANKNRIVSTLNNYNIGVDRIKATVGPTVTLYEIVPVAGIRISKIKNLEDDIALSLSAMGIRIIAPIPGKGTIGIEVPNKNPTMVSMKSVISSTKFQNSEMELPIALGKTISNETFVIDLAKMPHLLMAGATGKVNLLV